MTQINLFITVLVLTTQVYAQNLADKMNPPRFTSRTQAIYNVALVDYGKEHTSEQLSQIKELLEKRFYLATQKMLKVNVTFVKSLPYQFNIANYPKYTNGQITDPKRLQRLWYYDNVGAKILQEVYDNFVKAVPYSTVAKLDALAIVTGAQFDGLGYAYGRVAVTESPREIAWGTAGGGYTEPVDDYGKIVDELIHEIGHTLFMDHASSQCQKPGMTYELTQACCEKSAAKNDVMSYCRNRNWVDNENNFFGFSDCNLRNLKNKIIPALLNGGQSNVQKQEKCL